MGTGRRGAARTGNTRTHTHARTHTRTACTHADGTGIGRRRGPLRPRAHRHALRHTTSGRPPPADGSPRPPRGHAPVARRRPALGRAGPVARVAAAARCVCALWAGRGAGAPVCARAGAAPRRRRRPRHAARRGASATKHVLVYPSQKQTQRESAPSTKMVRALARCTSARRGTRTWWPSAPWSSTTRAGVWMAGARHGRPPPRGPFSAPAAAKTAHGGTPHSRAARRTHTHTHTHTHTRAHTHTHTRTHTRPRGRRAATWAGRRSRARAHRRARDGDGGPWHFVLDDLSQAPPRAVHAPGGMVATRTATSARRSCRSTWHPELVAMGDRAAAGRRRTPRAGRGRRRCGLRSTRGWATTARCSTAADATRACGGAAAERRRPPRRSRRSLASSDALSRGPHAGNWDWPCRPTAEEALRGPWPADRAAHAPAGAGGARRRRAPRAAATPPHPQPRQRCSWHYGRHPSWARHARVRRSSWRRKTTAGPAHAAPGA